MALKKKRRRKFPKHVKTCSEQVNPLMFSSTSRPIEFRFFHLYPFPLLVALHYEGRLLVALHYEGRLLVALHCEDHQTVVLLARIRDKLVTKLHENVAHLIYSRLCNVTA